MSYIDTRQHQLCGSLAGLPVYRPLEEYRDELPAGPANLLLGGGSGEHPVAVADALVCVAGYLNAYGLAILDAADDPVSILDDVAAGHHVTGEEILDLADQISGDRQARGMNFAAWGASEWVRFDLAARGVQFGAPFNERRHQRLENWIADSLGEYILVSYPDLLYVAGFTPQPELEPAFQAVRTMCARHPMYATVATWPSGYQIGGRLGDFGNPNMRH